MSIEHTPTPLGVSSLVDTQRSRVLAVEVERASHEIAADTWDAENLWALEGLRKHIDDLHLPQMVDQIKGELVSTDDYHPQQLAVQSIGWVPDKDPETLTAIGPKVRAIYSDIALAARPNNQAGRGGAYESIFMLIGYATERNGSLVYEKMVMSGLLGYNRLLYDELTEGQYSRLESERATKDGNDSNSARINDRPSTPGIETWYRSELRRISTQPARSFMSFQSERITDELAQKTVISKANYTHLTGPLIAGEHSTWVDRYWLAEYLGKFIAPHVPR